MKILTENEFKSLFENGDFKFNLISDLDFPEDFSMDNFKHQLSAYAGEYKTGKLCLIIQFTAPMKLLGLGSENKVILQDWELIDEKDEELMLNKNDDTYLTFAYWGGATAFNKYTDTAQYDGITIKIKISLIFDQLLVLVKSTEKFSIENLKKTKGLEKLLKDY